VKNWIIKKLGGYTHDELEHTVRCLLSMNSSACDNAAQFRAGSHEANYYEGKARAFETAARTLQDIMR
jgi:hypothetical protein